MKRMSYGLFLAIFAANPFFAQNMLETAISDPYFDWKYVENPSAKVHFKPGSFAERHRETLLRSVTESIREDLEFLGEEQDDAVLQVFFVDDRSEMERITGRPVTGFAHWGANAIFLVCSPEWRSFEKHEFAHILTMGRWGPPHESSRWMVEGIAIAADGWCREFSLDAIARHYLDRGELPPLDKLPARFRDLGEIRGGVYAGSVLAFIRKRHGPEAIRAIWERGLEAWVSRPSGSTEALETEWKAFLKRTVDDTVPVDIDAINELGCG